MRWRSQDREMCESARNNEQGLLGRKPQKSMGKRRYNTILIKRRYKQEHQTTNNNIQRMEQNV